LNAELESAVQANRNYQSELVKVKSLNEQFTEQIDIITRDKRRLQGIKISRECLNFEPRSNNCAPPPPVADATVRGTGDQRPSGIFFFIFPHFNHGRRHPRQTAIPSLIFLDPPLPL
jgi:hypothetical protein